MNTAKHLKAKFLSLALAAALACSPLTALAAGNTESTESPYPDTAVLTVSASGATSGKSAGTGMDITAYADDTILYSGTSGTCTWQINTDGVLTLAPADGISGTLDTYYYGDTLAESTYAPWEDYASEITKLVIEEGVAADTALDNAFANCSNLSAIEDIGNLDMSNVTSIKYIFASCTALTSLDLSAWDTSSLEDIQYAFNNCTSLKEVNVSGWDTTNVTNIRYLFYNCTSLESVDLTS